jgi:hypothetical protein
MVGTGSRIICRAALTLALVAGAVLATTTAASAADFGFNMYDANQDGKWTSVVNTNGDRLNDANLLDVSGNGRGDTWLSDTNQNGTADHVGFDWDENGRFEAWLIDTDENNVFEAIFIDKDGDGLPETMALTGPLTQQLTSIGNVMFAPLIRSRVRVRRCSTLSATACTTRPSKVTEAGRRRSRRQAAAWVS